MQTLSLLHPGFTVIIDCIITVPLSQIVVRAKQYNLGSCCNDLSQEKREVILPVPNVPTICLGCTIFL